MKYKIYLRVSTDKQEVATQEFECLRFIQSKENTDIFDYKIYSDPDTSSRIKMEKRLGLMDMLGSLKKGESVVTYKLDRLSRDVIEMVTIYRTIKQKDCEIFSLNDPDCNEFTVGLMGVLAQKERSDISARIKSKLQAKKGRCERISRHIPYGYTVDPNQMIKVKNQHDSGWTLKPGLLVQEPHEQSVLALMCQLHEEGISYHQVAKKLDVLGYTNRAGKPFQGMSIYRILDRIYQAKSKDQSL